MKKFLGVSLLVAGAVGSIAGAQSFDQYVSLKGSVSSLENKFTGSYDELNTVSGDRSQVINIDRKKSKTVGGFRLAYGLKFPAGTNAIRTEVEYGYNGKAKLNGTTGVIGYDPGERIGYRSQIKSQFIMANAYFDFNTGTEWTPYVGAGLGWARVKAENSLHYENETDSISKSSNNFAWNLTAGIAYEVNTNFTIDASYRYADCGKVKTSSSFSDLEYRDTVNTRSKVRANEFNLGFRYTF